MVNCPKCTQPNDDSAMYCVACNTPLKDNAPVLPAMPTRRLSIRRIVGLIGCAALFIYIAYRVMSALNALP